MSEQSGHSIVAAMNSRTVLIRPGGLLADGLGGSAKAGQAVFVRDGAIAAGRTIGTGGTADASRYPDRRS